MSANEGNNGFPRFKGQTPAPLPGAATFISHMSEKKELRVARSSVAQCSKYRLLERLLQVLWMFEDMIDTLFGAHGKLLLLVVAMQYRGSTERPKMDVCDQEIHKFSCFDSKND